MVAYTIEALSAILSEVPAITGRPTFKALWDAIRILLPLLHKIKHPDHPVEGIAEMMMEVDAYALVSAMQWLVTDCVGEVFMIPHLCINETDQRTEERKWTGKDSARSTPTI